MKFFNVEASYRGAWVSLEDEAGFSVHAESLGARSYSWQKSVATSPIMDGETVIHAKKSMATIPLVILISGEDQVDLMERRLLVEDIFSQFNFRLRITIDEMRETLSCQLPAEFSMESSHVYAHNNMAIARVTVPYLPETSTERLVE